ncbi:kinase-like domain-containing protein [Mycena crocata]|nr:kinase-like domain-containing protein [Mycena crocata]
MSFKERYRYDPDDLAAAEPENLASRERFWRDYQPWLLKRGYRLRARYQPDWVASWKSFKEETFAEDSLRIRYSKLIDAVRISDGALVVLKRSDPTEDPDEVDIAQFLTTGPRATDPRNHCVPIYETFPVPDLNDAVIIVMPLLYDLESPRFDTVGEAIECFRQIFEGVQFIHENNVAHGDCKSDSFMVDSKALFRGLSDQPHPWFPTRRRDYQGPPRTATTRTRSPVKYFIIDYNLSRRYEGPEPHLESPGWGGDKTVPEWRSRELCDPFPVDVYCLGNTIREVFTQGWDLDPGKKGFDFMKSLVNDMCAEDPKARPNMPEVVARFEKIRLGLSERKLRSRIASLDENPIAGVFRFAFHWSRQIIPIWRRIPATPHC